MNLFLATSRAFLTLGHPDDELLLDELSSRGISARWLAWDGDELPGDQDIVLIRTTWDYYLERDAFVRWCERCELRGATLVNSAQTVAWNSDKSYLADLAETGVATIPTTYWSSGTEIPSSETGWVVKPTISAGAYETRKITDRSEVEACAQALTERGFQVMVQPFAPNIADGEWSLLYFGADFSHAVLKRPKTGDFRVQDNFGGVVARVEPPDDVRDLADQTRGALDPGLTYARIDIVRFESRAVMMEVELIEPELFTRFAPGSVARLVDILLA